MDQISGLMPQIGWSPLMTPAAPKKAPATTVEPAGQATSAQGGLAADVGTQAGLYRGATGAGATGDGAGRSGESGLMPEPPPDPEAPTGPPPTFKITPLEAMAAEQLAPPDALEDPSPEVPEDAPDPAQALQAETPHHEERPAPSQPDSWASLKAPEDPKVSLTR